MQFPQIDRSLTLRQLQLLGHSENENVYLRFFYPSDDPRKAEDKGRKSDRLNFEEIEAYQRQGRGAYFVVNGGGHKNENVLSGRAIFYEHDDLDKEQQKTLWQILELPEPTFQVDTGGKSIHSYWVFDRPIPVPEWCELQRDLLEMSNGDRSIKNPARVMRLAGAWHISIDREGKPVYNQSRIISESGKNYSYEDLRTAVTVSEPEASLPLGPESTVYISREPGVNVPHYAPRHPDRIQIPVPELVPLEICLAKESRKIFAGLGKGERNTGGAKLVRDLIGTYNYLIAIGQSVDGEPRSLLEDYARNCNPPLPKSEVESIWQSGVRDNPSPSCGAEGVNNCIKGWYWRTRSQESEVRSQKLRQGRWGDGETGRRGDGESHQVSKPLAPSPSSSVLSFISLEESIERILDKQLDEAATDLALVELAKDTNNYNAAEIRSIAEKLIEERNNEDTLSERKQDLEKLEERESEEYLPFRDLFYDNPEVAAAFEQLCKINPKIQPQYFLGLYSPFSTVIGTKASVEVPVLGTFRGTVNIALVGESGNGKSIVSSIMMNPLYQLQQEREAECNKQKRDYAEALELWEQQHPERRGPKPRTEDFITVSDGFLVINEYSREGIVKNHADNPNGLLIHQEELVSIQRAANMYRQGKGDDKQFINNLYDNRPIHRRTKSESISVNETAVAIFGGIQPKIILGEMGEMDDADGQWARYNFVCGKEKKIVTNLNQPRIDVSPILYELYRRGLSAPVMRNYFDAEGLRLLQEFINEIETERWHTLQEGYRYVLSKASSEVCRLAMDLHWMNSLLSIGYVPPVIPAKAVKVAIDHKRYFLRQMQIIRTWGEATTKYENGLPPIYREIQKLIERSVDKAAILTTRMVLSARLTVLKNLKAKDIEKLFKDLAAMGKGVLVKCKRSVGLLISPKSQGGNQEFIPSPPPPPPSFAEFAESLLKDSQSLETSYINGFNSSAELLNLLGGKNDKIENSSFNLAAVSANSAMAQIQSGVGSANSEVVSANFSKSPSSPLDVVTIDVPVTKVNSVVSLERQPSPPTPLPHGEGRLQLKTEETKWLIQFLADLECESKPHPPFDKAQGARFRSQEQVMAEFEVAEEKYLLVTEQIEQHCPDYAVRMATAIGEVIDLLPEENEVIREEQEKLEDVYINDTSLHPTPHTPSSPTLAELQALLLACKTLAELKDLKKKYSDRVGEAYQKLSQQDQLVVDAVSATAVPYQVFKYVGENQTEDDHSLRKGSLVYIDPNSGKTNKHHVGVWLLRGIELGWRKSVTVSRDWLLEIKKVASDAVNGAVQPPLFEA